MPTSRAQSPGVLNLICAAVGRRNFSRCPNDNWLFWPENNTHAIPSRMTMDHKAQKQEREKNPIWNESLRAWAERLLTPLVVAPPRLGKAALMKAPLSSTQSAQRSHSRCRL